MLKTQPDDYEPDHIVRERDRKELANIPQVVTITSGKPILGFTKVRYIVPIIRTDTHVPSFYGILTIRQCGLSGLTPTRHEARIYLATPDDSNPNDIVERKHVWQRSTAKGLFLNKDFIAGQAFDLVREFENSHDLTSQ